MFEKSMTTDHDDPSVTCWDLTTKTTRPCRIIVEEPLSIRVEGRPYAVVMRTPGQELDHVAGFCLGEGLVDKPAEIGTLGFCDAVDTNVVTVALDEKRREKIAALIDRRHFISQTSCGICSKEIVADLVQHIDPITDDTVVDGRKAADMLENLKQHQPLHRLTRASHASVLCDPDFSVLSKGEDVGRHNALDKAIGHLFRQNRLDRARVLLLSSRTSYELIQKAGRAQIPIVLSVSRPTTLAAALARQLNMTLACLGWPRGLLIFSGSRRIRL